MEEKKLNIVWLGDSGFPYGLAAIQKVILACKGLVKAGCKATVINRRAVHKYGMKNDLNKEGYFEGIKYVYPTGSPYRHPSFLMRNFLRLLSTPLEWNYLYKLFKKRELDTAIVHTRYYFLLLNYRILSKLFSFRLILLCVELYSTHLKRKSRLLRINDYLFEKFGFNLVDGVLPISDYLINVIRTRSKTKPILKVPMITDFSRFETAKKEIPEKYFLFCGAARYIEIIIFALEAFDLLDHPEYYLYIVANGSPRSMSRLRNEIDKIHSKERIKVFSNLTDQELTNLYASATGLLIPMRPIIQDIARFPHKIGEYIASGNPVISTNIGEIQNYFSDQKNALIAEEYNVQQFSDKMKFVITNPEKAVNIGKLGRIDGLASFDYISFGEKIKKFIYNLNPR